MIDLVRPNLAAAQPERAARDTVHNAIFNELCLGKINQESKGYAQNIILDLGKAGAEAVVLACTELPLLIHPEDTPVRIFDSMALHVKKAVDFALEG
jgi:aspartate racemase